MLSHSTSGSDPVHYGPPAQLTNGPYISESPGTGQQTPAPIGVCPYCSSPVSSVWHLGACPKVKAKEFYPDGALKRVEFFEP